VEYPLYYLDMEKHKVPQVKVRLNQEQHEWLINHVEDSGTNINAFLKYLVQKAMNSAKGYTNKDI
jgi:hypothetical protein